MEIVTIQNVTNAEQKQYDAEIYRPKTLTNCIEKNCEVAVKSTVLTHFENNGVSDEL